MAQEMGRIVGSFLGGVGIVFGTLFVMVLANVGTSYLSPTGTTIGEYASDLIVTPIQEAI